MGAVVETGRQVRRLGSSRAARLLLLVGGAVIWWLLSAPADAHAESTPPKPTNLVSGLTTTVDKTVHQTKHTADKTVRDTKHTVDKTVRDTKHTVDKTVHQAKRTVDETVRTVDKTVRTVDETVRTVKHTVDRTVQQTSDTVDRVVHRASASRPASHSEHDAEPTSVRESPARRTLTAFPAPAPHRAATTERRTPPTGTAVAGRPAVARPLTTVVAAPRDARASEHETAAVTDHATAGRPARATASAPATPVPAPSPSPVPGVPGGGLAVGGSATSAAGQHDTASGYLHAQPGAPNPTSRYSSRRDETWALLSRADLVTVRPG